MGLAVARALLRAHGGAIEAASTPGEGARFRFWIPLKQETAPQAGSHDVERMEQEQLNRR
jgi:signal transduction histidine kinase